MGNLRAYLNVGKANLFKRNIPTLIALAFTSSLASTHAQTLTFETIALEGEAAPDGNGSFSRFEEAVVNNAGQVAFLAHLDDTSGGFFSDDRGIFLGDGRTGLSQIVRAGQAAPDRDGSFSPSTLDNSLVLNNAGQVAFWGELNNTVGGSSDYVGIFRGDGLTEPMQIVREGQTGANDATFTDLLFRLLPAFNDAGQVAFYGELTDNSIFNPGVSRDIFLGDGVTEPTRIAREGQDSPSGDGAIFAFEPPVLNNAGQVAFEGEILISGGNRLGGIFRSDEAIGLAEIAREGEASPDGNGKFSGFRNIMLNDSGQVVFRGELTGTNGDAGDDTGIFVGDGATGLTQIAREGQAAPDDNGSFSQFHFSRLPVVNGVGQVAFLGGLIGTSHGASDDTGIFLGDGITDPMQIAREGQASPDGNGSFALLTDPVLNNAGQVAFASLITDNDLGIFLYDDLHGMIKVVREGDSFLGSTLTNLFFFSSQESSGLNDLGQIAFRFDLADGRSGIAIASLVPEPTPLLLAAMVSGGAFLRRRQACDLRGKRV